jgi:exonuclease SbcD
MSQIAKKLLSVTITDTHLKESNIEENWQIYKGAIDLAIQHNFSVVYHLGDIFDSRKAQPLKILTTFFDILQMFREKGIKLIAIPGNHEKTSYNSIESFLIPFGSHPNLDLIQQHCPIRLDEEHTIHMVPFFSDDLYRLELEKARQIVQNSRKKHLLFTHVGFSGARMNSGIIVDGIKPSEVDFFDKVYVGHFHDKQTLTNKILYIGSSLQHNYGETPDKGLTLIFDDFSIETIECGTKKYIKQEIDVESLKANDIKEIIELSQSTNNELRVILTGSEEKVKSFNKQLLISEGISVQTKTDSIEREVVQDRVEPFTPLILQKQFELFCERNKLDIQLGNQYLSKVI